MVYIAPRSIVARHTYPSNWNNVGSRVLMRTYVTVYPPTVDLLSLHTITGRSGAATCRVSAGQVAFFLFLLKGDKYNNSHPRCNIFLALYQLLP